MNESPLPRVQVRCGQSTGTRSRTRWLLRLGHTSEVVGPTAQPVQPSNTAAASTAAAAAAAGRGAPRRREATVDLEVVVAATPQHEPAALVDGVTRYPWHQQARRRSASAEVVALRPPATTHRWERRVAALARATNPLGHPLCRIRWRLLAKTGNLTWRQWW